MSIEIKNIDNQEVWEKALEAYSPHSFLQSWQWGEAQKALSQKIWRLGIYQENILKGVAFVYKITAKRGVFLFCPHGPLLDWSKKDYFVSLVNFLKNLGKKEKADFIRIAPLAKSGGEAKELFSQNGFKDAPVHMMHPELAWLLDITKSEEELLKEMEKRTRYSIRKAEKDAVTVKVSNKIDELDIFYKMYLETAKRQKFVPFSKNYVKREFEIFSQDDKILLFTAYYQNEAIATAMIVFDNDSAFYHHGASIRKYSNVPAAALIQWSAIKEAKKRNLKYYNFWGIVENNNKNHPWHGLSKFKRGFGGFSEGYLHVQDLPLTKKYILNYTIEKIRKILKKY